MSESYVAQGMIHSIGQTMEYGQNGFTKREFVVCLSGDDVNPEYPDYVQFELIKDKCTLMDGYQVGHEIKIKFNLTGRLYNNPTKGEQCFPALRAWKIAPADGAQNGLIGGQQAGNAMNAPRAQHYAQQPAPQQQQAPKQQAPQQQQPPPYDPAFDDSQDIPF